MARRPRSLTMLLVAFALAACGGAPSTPSSPGGTAPATTAASSGASSPPPASTASGASSPAASDEPGDGGEAFTCDLPIVDPGTASIANIVDVRAGTHDGYDRLVFEFEQGTPEFTLDRAEPPFTEDGSGMPLEVDGESFLGLVMRGGTKQLDSGESSYDGDTDLDTGAPMLVHAVEGGDFERQSTWYLGLAEEACVRILLLDEPPRLVIDVEH
jgi:hypothetical protein